MTDMVILYISCLMSIAPENIGTARVPAKSAKISKIFMPAVVAETMGGVTMVSAGIFLQSPLRRKEEKVLSSFDFSSSIFSFQQAEVFHEENDEKNEFSLIIFHESGLPLQIFPG